MHRSTAAVAVSMTAATTRGPEVWRQVAWSTMVVLLGIASPCTGANDRPVGCNFRRLAKEAVPRNFFWELTCSLNLACSGTVFYLSEMFYVHPLRLARTSSTFYLN